MRKYFVSLSSVYGRVTEAAPTVGMWPGSKGIEFIAAAIEVFPTVVLPIRTTVVVVEAWSSDRIETSSVGFKIEEWEIM
jgi:hypothetical protein